MVAQPSNNPTYIATFSNGRILKIKTKTRRTHAWLLIGSIVGRTKQVYDTELSGFSSSKPQAVRNMGWEGRHFASKDFAEVVRVEVQL